MKRQQKIASTNSLLVIKILGVIVAQVAIPFVFLLLALIFIPLPQVEKWRILAPCTTIMIVWVVISTIYLHSIRLITIKQLEYTIPLLVAMITVIWLVTYHCQPIIIIIAFAGLAGGSFLGTKFVVSFFLGRSSTSGAVIDKSNILHQLDSLKKEKHSYNDAMRHKDFLHFALDKKQIINCIVCQSIVFNVTDIKTQATKMCTSCLIKKQNNG